MYYILFILSYVILYLLYYIIFLYVMLHYAILYYVILCYITIYYIMLYYIILYIKFCMKFNAATFHENSTFSLILTQLSAVICTSQYLPYRYR
jgi:hypothetical protein